MAVKSKTSLAYEELKAMILSRELLPGTQLSEVNLAQKLNISRTPIREAIRRLQENGYVSIEENRSASVRVFSILDVIKLLEFIEGIEGMASFLYAEKVKNGDVSQQELSELRGIVRAIEKSLQVQDYISWEMQENSFHSYIVEHCGNNWLCKYHRQSEEILLYILRFMSPIYVDRQSANVEHGIIVDKIEQGKPDQARQIAQQHRHTLRNRLVRACRQI